jgi:4-hydroxyproline epimerase
MPALQIVDSHTEGEPTRLIVAGGPDLGTGPLRVRLDRLRRDHDHLRRAVVAEPRASSVWVGALLCAPEDPTASAGVIFFNDAGYLGMCGHGTIGLVASLAHLGRIASGEHRIETPVGDVRAVLHDDARVSVHNVPSYRARANVALDVDGVRVVGDVAWGGNWFFLVREHPLPVAADAIPALHDLATRIRRALAAAGITGDDGAEIDHVELLAPLAGVKGARGFVLCPGGAFDRSPCGTGTSAELACLAADAHLAPGEPWVQESVIGSRFEASYAPLPGGRVAPVVTGRAFVTLTGALVIDPNDPFAVGIPAAGVAW